MALIVLLCIIGFLIYRLLSGSSRFKHDDRHYSQGPVMVMLAERKISIRGKTYDVDAIQGIESKQISVITTAVYIKVDDFAKPIHTVQHHRP